MSNKSYTVGQEFCDAAKALDFRSLYQIQNAGKMVFSAISIPIILYMVKAKKHLIYGEHHFIIHFKIVIMLLFAINNTIMHGLQVTDRLFKSDNPCLWVRPANGCVFFKAMQNATSTTISTTLFFITAEKAIFVVLDPSVKAQSIVIRLFSVIQCFLTALIFIINIFIDYDNTLPVLHCTEPTARIFVFANVLSYGSIACSTFTLLSSFLLKFYISRMLRKEINLSRTFILRQSKVTNNAFLPLILFNAAMIIILNVIGIVFRPIFVLFDKATMKAFQGLSNMIPYYAFLAPLLLMYGMNRLKEGRTKEITQAVRPRMNGKVVPEGEIYETALKKMWK